MGTRSERVDGAAIGCYGAVVLRRLLLLLSLMLALPATAQPACHADAVSRPRADVAASHHAHVPVESQHEHGSADGWHAAGHDCLGCIPPDMLLGARVGQAAVPRAPAMRVAATAVPAGEVRAPTPPPPKRA